MLRERESPFKIQDQSQLKEREFEEVLQADQLVQLQAVSIPDQAHDYDFHQNAQIFSKSHSILLQIAPDYDFLHCTVIWIHSPRNNPCLQKLLPFDE